MFKETKQCYSRKFTQMKKVNFYSALALLILANLIVFACKKESSYGDNILPSETKSLKATNRYTCDELNVYNGQHLILCGPDGSGCQICGGNYGSFTLTHAIEQFPFSSGVFYLCNPTPANITCVVNFGCATQDTQQITVPKLSFLTYHLEPGPHCCVAVLGCP